MHEWLWYWTKFCNFNDTHQNISCQPIKKCVRHWTEQWSYLDLTTDSQTKLPQSFALVFVEGWLKSSHAKAVFWRAWILKPQITGVLRCRMNAGQCRRSGWNHYIMKGFVISAKEYHSLKLAAGALWRRKQAGNGHLRSARSKLKTQLPREISFLSSFG